MMCMMCAVASMGFLALKTRKYVPKAFQRSSQELCKSKSQSYRFLQIFGKNEKISSNFQVSKIDDFHSKSLKSAENHRGVEILSHRAFEVTIRKDFAHTFKFIKRAFYKRHQTDHFRQFSNWALYTAKIFREAFFETRSSQRKTTFFKRLPKGL